MSDVVVETRFGRVAGCEEEGVCVFRGLPYAIAARWRPPAAPAPWSGVRSAQVSGPVAPQRPGMIAALLGGGSETQSEDCLSVNVWTPGVDAGRRPVMVWIHGGGFTTGSGSLAVYDGSALARRGDVVVVTLNYRLGALGFLALPEFAQEEGGAFGNFGLLDQIQALEWVRDHIAAFGGDPDRVTVSGQSAGAMCIGALLVAPRACGLYAQVILQSGAARNLHTRETAEQVGEAFLVEAGVTGRSLDALRELPVDAVLAAQLRTVERLRREIPDPPFQPIVDGGPVFPRPPLEAVQAGAAAGVPMLIGTNADEWRFYGLGDPKANQLDEAGLLRRYRRGLPGVDAAGRELAERVVATYREARAGHASVEARDLWFAIQTDRWFRYPATRLADAHGAHDSPVWSYLFTWKSPALGGGLGSCHSLDLPFVFGSAGLPALSRFVGEGGGVAALSERMQGAWLAFVREGVPAHARLPDWPRYGAPRRATLVLGPECAVVDAPAEAERAFWDEVA